MIIKWLVYLSLSFTLMLFPNASFATQPGLVSANTEKVFSSPGFVNSIGSADPILPANVLAPDDLISFMRLMLRRSRSFRWQCLQIAGSNHMRIKVVYTTPPKSIRNRAMSKAERYVDGFIQVTVYLYPPHTHSPELIAHEFEHALEQAEGLNLKTLAVTRGSGVRQVDNNVFETKRAIIAGEIAAGEFISYRQPK